MKIFISTVATIIAVVALVVSSGQLVFATEPQPEQSQFEQQKAEHRKLFLEGAELWPVYCAQCHNARPGSEFSPRQWDSIMMHMRGQANLPAKDARAILEYLKATH